MDRAVIYSEAALADLQQITAFIAKDNAEVAESLRIGWRSRINYQLSSISYRLFGHSITSSSRVPSTSTLPSSLRSRPSAMWSQ
jgi:plasmid stabilization system protein ParE